MASAGFTGLAFILLLSCVDQGGCERHLSGDAKITWRGHFLTFNWKTNAQNDANRGMKREPALFSSRRLLRHSPPPSLQEQQQRLVSVSRGSEILALLSKDYSHRPRSRPPIHNRLPLNHPELHP